MEAFVDIACITLFDHVIPCSGCEYFHRYILLHFLYPVLHVFTKLLKKVALTGREMTHPEERRLGESRSMIDLGVVSSMAVI